MHIVETLNEGLKRNYTLTLAASDIAARVEAEIANVAPKVKMAGFREGKVPTNLIKKMHGESIHGDIVNTYIQEAVQNLMSEHSLKPAMAPSVELAPGYALGQDAVLNVAMEILPIIESTDIANLKLECLSVPFDEAKLEESLKSLAQAQKDYQDADADHAAALGDQVVMDFTGTMDGVEFEGGKGNDVPMPLGSGRLIPGFEEQLVGMKAGEARRIHVTFPEDYDAAELKGKAAEFAVQVHKVQTAPEVAIDDAFAKSLGLDSLDKLKEVLKGNLEQENNGLTRTHMKRQLLDILAERHSFLCPEAMVEAEYAQILQHLEHEAAHETDPAAAKAEIENDAAEYRRIAERRVRLGLLLSEIGQAEKIEISNQEVNMLAAQAAQNYPPADRERFYEYLNNEPMALAQLRAPLYEDKVIDHLFATAEITERHVTLEELEAAIEAEDTAVPELAKADVADKAAETEAAPAEVVESEAAPAKPKATKKPKAKAEPETEAAPEAATE